MWLAVVLVCGLNSYTTPCAYTNTLLVYDKDFCESVGLDSVVRDLNGNKQVEPTKYKYAYIKSAVCVKVDLDEEPTKEE